MNRRDPSGLFWDDVVNNFTTTNNTIPGVTTPTGMGLATAGTTAQAVGGTTLGSWALGGFGGQTLSGVAFTGLETGAIAAGVSVLNAALMTSAWETGIGIGSVISAIPVYGENMNISQWWANYWYTQSHRNGRCQ